jgi:hypothetical protein
VVTTQTTIIPTFDASGVKMRNIFATILPFGSGKSSADPAGLLGFDFLAELVLHVDFAGKHVTAIEPRNFQMPASNVAVALPVRLGTHVPVASATIGGATAERMIVDTGSNGWLLLFDYFTGRHKDLLRDRHDTTMYSINVPDREQSEAIGGTVNGRSTTIDAVRLSGQTIKNVRADIVTSKDAFRFDTDGLIGTELLSLFTVDFDYAAGRIFLTPNHRHIE